MAAISSPPATTAQGPAAALAPSALSSLCGGLMEAVWLTAVAALPSLFNPYSQDNFGPEKQRLLHILGLTMAAAWIVRSVEERLALGEAKTRLWKLFQRPAAWFLAALTLSYIAAACLSVEPARSWWGDFQGSGFATCTFLSHLVLLAAMAAHLRDRDQVERFATAVLVGSVPVCLYGLLQRAGFDPIKWSWGRDEISSLLGHQIYVAAYLGMVFPLCLRRIIQIARDLRTESGGNTQKTGTSRPRGIPVRSAAQPKPGVETTRRLKIAALGVYCLLAILQL